jgi:hypothetical protein
MKFSFVDETRNLRNGTTLADNGTRLRAIKSQAVELFDASVSPRRREFNGNYIVGNISLDILSIK